MTDEHLKNAIAMLERTEMPSGHDFPSDSMAAYYADQDMNSEWEKYHHAQVWLEVLRQEKQRRRMRGPSARCSHGVAFHDCSAQAESHRQRCREEFEAVDAECPQRPPSEPLPGHHWIAHMDSKDRWTIFKCARCGARRELKS
jgi:hypothetical protein